MDSSRSVPISAPPIPQSNLPSVPFRVLPLRHGTYQIPWSGSIQEPTTMWGRAMMLTKML